MSKLITILIYNISKKQKNNCNDFYSLNFAAHVHFVWRNIQKDKKIN